MSTTTNPTFRCLGYKDEFPPQTKYYKNFIVEDYIDLSKEHKNVKNILSIKSNVTVDKIEVCRNTLCYKEHATIYTSALLMLKLKMSFQIKYVGGCDNKSVFAQTKNFYKIMYMPVPHTISDLDIEEYYRKNRINAQVYVEDLQTTSIADNIVKFSLVGFLNILFIKSNY